MALYRQYGAAFPPAYRDELLARSAVADVQRIEGLTDEDALDLSLYRPLEAPAGALRCKVYRRGERVSLSRRAADVRVARVDRDRRAALPRDPARGPAGVAVRLRAARPGPGRRRRHPRPLPRGLRARVAGRRRAGRLQRPHPRRRPRLARGDDAARRRALPAPGGHPVQRPLHGVHAARPRGRRERARGAVPRTLRPGGRAGRRGPGRGADRAGHRRRRLARPGPDPARLPERRHRDAAHELLPAGPEAVRELQAGPAPDPAHPAAAPAVRDLRALAAGGGRAPARRDGRARRPALVGPARGLPHGDPRPDEGADGQERRDRAGRVQGRLRRQAPRRPGGRVLHDVPVRPARRDRQHRRRLRRPALARRARRRRRSVPGGRRGQGHGDVQRHRQRRLRAVRVLARRRVRVRRVGRLRPQGDGHHGPQRVGERAAPLPRARRRRPGAGLHRRRHRRHERRRVRQRHDALAAHPARGRVRPPPHLPGPGPRSGGRAWPSASACSRCPGRAGTTTTAP